MESIQFCNQTIFMDSRR